MKKHFLRTILTTTLVGCALCVSAQVTCTINTTTSYTTAPALANGVAYKNFTDAIAQLNAATIASPVVFNVAAGQTFTETALLSITKTGTATNTIAFHKSGSGANPVIVPTAGTAAADAIVKIAAVSYITFDGIDLRENTANTAGNAAMEYGYSVSNNASTTVGATHNTIQNCTVTLNRSNTNTTYGVYQVNSQTAASVCSNNTYNNITVTNSFYGIYITGKGTTILDDGNVVKYCTVGAATANDIGSNSANTNPVYGIFCKNQSNVSVYNCEVRNATATYNNATTAVETDAMYFIVAGTSNVYNNKIHDISNNSTGTTSAIASGMYLLTIGATDVVNVYNNFVSGIYNGDALAGGGTTGSVRVMGFYLASACLGTENIYDNSVFLQNSTNNYLVSTADLYSGSSGVNTLNVVNNIFKNNYVSGGSGVCYAVDITSTNTVLNTSDYNNYDIATTGSSNTGRLGVAASTGQTLADWQTLSGKDTHSKQFTTGFTSTVAGAENLHLNVTAVNHSYNGIPVSSPAITTDIDGDTRGSVIPYIGADEIPTLTLPVSFVSVNAHANNGAIAVSWNVAQEINVAKYGVERSADGIQFTAVALVEATGNNVYEWTDGSPLTGNNFYRIKALDKDGQYAYSSVVMVAVNGAKAGLLVYPNPVQNKTINLQLNGLGRDAYTVTIINAAGQQVYSRSLGNVEGSQSLSLPLNQGVAPGFYILVVNGRQVQLQQGIIIQ